MSEAGVPLLFLSHSFGTCLAYECAQYLRLNNVVKIPQIISLAGIHPLYLSKLRLYQDQTGLLTDSIKEMMRAASLEMYGTLPAYLDECHPSYRQDCHDYAIEGNVLSRADSSV